MIFGFLPDIQLQAWIESAPAELQLKLVRYAPSHFAQNIQLVYSLLMTKNVDAIQLIKVETKYLLECLHLHGLTLSRDIITTLSHYLAAAHVKVAINLNDYSFNLDESMCHIFDTMRPMFDAGVFYAQVSSTLDMNLKLKKLLHTMPNVCFDDNDTEKKFTTAVQNGQWGEAAYFWNPLHRHVSSLRLYPSFEPTHELSDDSFADLSHSSSDTMDSAQTNSSDDDDFTRPAAMTDDFAQTSFSTLESALDFVNNVSGDAITPFDAIMCKTVHEWKQKPWDELVWIFKRSCSMGHVHIIREIWTIASKQQHDILRPLLALCKHATSTELFAYLWTIEPDFVRSIAEKWARFAFNHRNIVLWRFLHSHALIDDDMLFHSRSNICLKIASKRVQFLQTVWQDRDEWRNVTPKLIRYALCKRNAGVLRFLCTKTTFPNALLCSRFLDFARLNLYQAIAQITDSITILRRDLDTAYTFAVQTNCVNLLRTMMRVVPLALLGMNAVTLFQKELDRQAPIGTEMGKMLLETHSMSPHMLFSIAPLSRTQQLWLFASIHFDLDNIEWSTDVAQRTFFGVTETNDGFEMSLEPYL